MGFHIGSSNPPDAVGLGDVGFGATGRGASGTTKSGESGASARGFSSTSSSIVGGAVRSLTCWPAVLGVASLKPSPLFPDAPVIATDLPGYEAISWFGLFVPWLLNRNTRRQLVAAGFDPDEPQVTVPLTGSTPARRGPCPTSSVLPT